ncbi:flavin-dependent oxidoreductase [Aquincola sp. S2]|uniref:Flavin-dependent oxidoreductase n=1 Tax=Pseudaquabacterium terrae TaxID=2732868 RepID=A0ABX2ET42_9BURK|nr:flavin-dependent oxidoreductase [Aquabacterium terrae]NRF71870.1 flavin-dependent oxidoreductase [Aquabacterium terrae]
MNPDDDVIIIGAGIGGLAFALALQRAGVPFRIYESAPELKPLGVGLNLLPHAIKALTDLGLQKRLLAKGVETREYSFYTRHGQHVYSEPRGMFAGYDWPQISIHRGDLHSVLLEAVKERCGADKVVLDHKCVAVEQDETGVTVRFDNGKGETLAPQRGAIAVACDGVHSVLRRQHHPKEAVPRYEGTTQYRGTTRLQPFLSGASMAYLGTYETGKLIIYPIRNNIDAEGRQLVNWVIELSKPNDQLLRDWNRQCSVDEFIANFEDWRFDWMDVPAVLRAADSIYEYPMVDQDPLPFWTVGRTTLMGDAAHPMMPRGSNGAAQAIIDGITLAPMLAARDDWPAVLKDYEAQRLKATGDVVLANREIAPDAVLRVVHERTGGQPFRDIADVISRDELVQWQERYRKVAGFAADDLRKAD